MNQPLSQKIISTLILVSFLMVAFLGLFVIVHGPDGQMVGDCPFSLTNTTFCPQDLIASVSHHLNAYHSFLNVTINDIVAILILSLALAVGAWIFFQQPLLLFDPHQLKISFYNSPPTSERRKIIHWLSLLENSPSLLRGA